MHHPYFDTYNSEFIDLDYGNIRHMKIALPLYKGKKAVHPNTLAIITIEPICQAVESHGKLSHRLAEVFIDKLYCSTRGSIALSLSSIPATPGLIRNRKGKPIKDTFVKFNETALDNITGISAKVLTAKHMDLDLAIQYGAFYSAVSEKGTVLLDGSYAGFSASYQRNLPPFRVVGIDSIIPFPKPEKKVMIPRKAKR